MSKETTSFLTTLPEGYLFEGLAKWVGHRDSTNFLIATGGTGYEHVTQLGYEAVHNITEYAPMSLGQLQHFLRKLEESNKRGLAIKPKLEVLDLSELSFEDRAKVNNELVERLAAVTTNLTTVNLRLCNNITGDGIIALLKRNPSIQTIILPDKVADIDLEKIAAVTTNLTTVDLSKCKSITSDRFVAILKSNPGVQEIALGYWVSDIDLRKIAEITTHLTKVTLFNCNKTTGDGIVALLKSNPDICELNLDFHFQLTDVDLKKIAAVTTHLTKVTLKSCDRITPNGIVGLFANNPGITVLYLSGSGQSNDTDLAMIAAVTTNLTTVKLEYCPDITGDGIATLLKSNSAVQELNLNNCFQLTDVDLAMIAAVTTTLTIVELGNCPGITGDGIATLLQSNSAVQELNLSKCSQLTDVDLAMIAAVTTTLTQVYLGGCDKLTGSGIAALLASNPGVQTLRLPDAPQLTDLDLKEIAAVTTNLTDVHLETSQNISVASVAALVANNPNLKNLGLCGIRESTAKELHEQFPHVKILCAERGQSHILYLNPQPPSSPSHGVSSADVIGKVRAQEVGNDRGA